MFDSIIAPLACSACGTTTPDAEIQTHLRGVSADGSALQVGFEFDAIDLELDSILGADHSLIHLPPPEGPIRLLDMWICPACRIEQWAVVEIAGRKICRIEAVTPDRETLAAAHFISETNAPILGELWTEMLPTKVADV